GIGGDRHREVACSAVDQSNHGLYVVSATKGGSGVKTCEDVVCGTRLLFGRKDVQANFGYRRSVGRKSRRALVNGCTRLARGLCNLLVLGRDEDAVEAVADDRLLDGMDDDRAPQEGQQVLARQPLRTAPRRNNRNSSCHDAFRTSASACTTCVTSS